MKKLGLTALTALVGILPIEASAGNAKYYGSVSDAIPSFAKLTSPYNLPGRVNGGTWLELHQGRYYAESNFKRRVAPGLDMKAQTNHPDNLVGRVGIGMSTEPPLPDCASAEVTAFPFFFDKTGKINRSEINYSASANLPYGVKASSFGEWTLQKRLEWIYGEVELEKPVRDKFSIGWNIPLRNPGKGALPSGFGHRVTVKAKF
ncbi:hypothetical protein HY500_03470 [Candidatus Woesearchaeota archaeon]|nr:hypothetical protein [Candidatus Woesearchaeota archaeon]